MTKWLKTVINVCERCTKIIVCIFGTGGWLQKKHASNAFCPLLSTTMMPPSIAHFNNKIKKGHTRSRPAAPLPQTPIHLLRAAAAGGSNLFTEQSKRRNLPRAHKYLFAIPHTCIWSRVWMYLLHWTHALCLLSRLNLFKSRGAHLV